MKIEFHYTYIIVAIGFIITGYFPNLIVFTSIIIIHEIGHFVIAKINSLNPQKIIIYPFGGITKMDNPINTKIKKELFVAFAGITFQTIYYIIIVILYKQNIIREYIFNIFTTYHYNILIFNILPVHPLDGSKILNLILSIFIPYKLTQRINILISILISIILIITNYYQFNYTTILIASIIISNIVKCHQNIEYTFNKFLLERYLHKYHPPKTKKITKIEDMYKDKYHIIKGEKHYLTEKQALEARFNEKITKMFD